ncbi:MAG: zinc transporter ZupT [Campylobacteraceae bacterium]|nr:zinc transporter ZupT [Campylobacteraceae bacterium]
MESLAFSNYVYAFLLTLLAGLSTGVGAAIAFFTKPTNTKFLSFGMGFSAGVMIYISFVEILVKSKTSFISFFGEIMGESLSIICFFIGITISFLIDKLVPKDVNPHEFKNANELRELRHDDKISSSRLKRTGIVTAIAISIHNFPEGFATFVASLNELSLGVAIAAAIAIHNIPEGMAVSLPIYHATGNRKKAFKYAFFSGLAEPLGAIVGFFLIAPLLGDLTLGITFGIVAGIMVFISLDELLPAAKKYGNGHVAILGVVGGMAIMAISLFLFKII